MSTDSSLPDVHGLMFIGDPHLEGRTPGFRRDDYAEVSLGKFGWCLEFARRHGLQPILLGDLFQLPQDNPNWLLSRVIELLQNPLPAIYGNHDVRENSLKPNDSIHILFAGGHLVRLSEEEPWRGRVDGKRVTVGGTVWGDRLPKGFHIPEVDHALTAWVTHHDIFIPGYEEAGRIRPAEIPGIDLIVNGHVHRRLAPVRKGGTCWVTAGNITRRTRSDASRKHVPAVVCLYPQGAAPDVQSVDVVPLHSQSGDDWELIWVRVPHEPFEDVFHPELETDGDEEGEASGFIADLRELTTRRTDTGAGLTEFLNRYADQFEPAVTAEIMRLAAEVTSEESDSHSGSR